VNDHKIGDLFFWSERFGLIEVGGVVYRANIYREPRKGAEHWRFPGRSSRLRFVIRAAPTVRGTHLPDELLAIPPGTKGHLTFGVADVVLDEVPVVLDSVERIPHRNRDGTEYEMRAVRFRSVGPFRSTSTPFVVLAEPETGESG
jgi:hypothetical protein